ncbi:dolichyl-diphosphooligosaccharide--protein glycosyltransferase subunit STT3 [SAR116 cluster bacterium]|nr:dolichyl-diphosphooligosaccharide--protein glycosyltransferase subunit STT3 [SAR116 cluster bacterium]
MDDIKLLSIFKERNFGLIGIISVLILTLIIGLLAFKTRNDQWNVWKLNKNITFYNNSPLLSTADGPYFLGQAKYLNENKPISLQLEKRFFPEHEQEKSNNEFSIFNISLLPISINYFSFFFDNDLLLTANKLIPITALITAILIAVFFIILGFGYEGVIAGIGASLSQSIYVRTSVGRVDTDLLNIGLFYLILGLILASIKIEDNKNRLVLICIAGFFNFLFTWWYQHPGFLIPFIFTLVLLQFFNRQKLSFSIIQIILFVLFSGPFFAVDSFSSIIVFINEFVLYSSKESITNNLLFPDTFKTITELQTLDFKEYSNVVFGEGSEWVVLFGLSGFILFMLFNFNKSISMLPAILFLLMSIFVGKRFAMYAIPIYWFGVAYLFICSVLLINKTVQLSKILKISENFIKNFLVTFSTVFLISVISLSSISFCENDNIFNCKPKYVPKPSFSNKTTQAFDLLIKEGFDTSSIIVTWWDYGYWLNYFSGLTSVHDGGSQRSPKTYLVANALTSTSQKNSYDIINYVVSNNVKKVREDSSQNYINFINEISKSKPIDRPVYFYLSRDMIKWWSTITYIGNWDIINGAEKNKTVFERIDCNPKSQSEMVCGGAVLNVNSGSISNGNQLDSLVISQNGKMIRRFDYDKKGQVSLLIDIINEKRFFYVVSPDTLRSTFTKLYFLNNNNSDYFQLVKDGYPSYKIFKIN